MHVGDFHLVRVLRIVSRTPLLRDYCRARGIPLDTTARRRDACGSVLAALLPDARERIEQELATVNELAGADGNAHLLASGGTLPADDVPGGVPLALWYLLHRPEEFHEVLSHHAGVARDPWHTARGPVGRAVADVLARAGHLRAALRNFFREGGSGPFCVVDAAALPDSAAFLARVADRVQYVESFTARGAPSLHRIRPVTALLFAYNPADGMVRLRSPVRTADQVGSLLRCFARAVLETDVTLGGECFDLDRLQTPFHPQPDAPDMVGIRVRSLHLRYPSRLGRRLLKLETLPGDEPDAMDALLAAHVGTEALTVIHGELEVRLLAGGRSRDVPVRLWRDHCSLDHTPLGERLRTCLRSWGLSRE